VLAHVAMTLQVVDKAVEIHTRLGIVHATVQGRAVSSAGIIIFYVSLSNSDCGGDVPGIMALQTATFLVFAKYPMAMCCHCTCTTVLDPPNLRSLDSPSYFLMISSSVNPVMALCTCLRERRRCVRQGNPSPTTLLLFSQALFATTMPPPRTYR